MLATVCDKLDSSWGAEAAVPPVPGAGGSLRGALLKLPGDGARSDADNAPTSGVRGMAIDIAFDFQDGRRRQ